MKTLRLLVLAGFVLGLSSPAWARMPRSREFCGILFSASVPDRTIIVDDAKAHRLSVVWTRDTIFVHDGYIVERPNLNNGERICVYYHTPFFGPKYVAKVSW